MAKLQSIWIGVDDNHRMDLCVDLDNGKRCVHTFHKHDTAESTATKLNSMAKVVLQLGADKDKTNE